MSRIRSLCNRCNQTYLLVLMPGDTQLLEQISEDSGGGRSCPCPRLCGGRINVEYDSIIGEAVGARLASVLTVTGLQLYKAVNGAGLPDEIPSDVEVIDSLLRANQVVRCVLERVNDRVYIHELHLSNGSIIHLTAGGRGAQVLKITKGVGT